MSWAGKGPHEVKGQRGQDLLTSFQTFIKTFLTEDMSTFAWYGDIVAPSRKKKEDYNYKKYEVHEKGSECKCKCNKNKNVTISYLLTSTPYVGHKIYRQQHVLNYDQKIQCLHDLVKQVFMKQRLFNSHVIIMHHMTAEELKAEIWSIHFS